MEISEKLKSLPDTPGVYIMKNAAGDIIYIGKAVSLKNRVRSYFQSSKNHSPKVISMVSQIADFEYILTDSEIEALILECNLIKKHKPKYNIRLVDDKTYPYLKVTVDEEFPRVYITRSVIKDGSKYYGPYTDVTALKETMNLLKRIFPLRSCKQKSLANQKRPCLNYHIKRCLAPCDGKVERSVYMEMINRICLFLEGRQEALVKSLNNSMEQAAMDLNFEKAALFRDQIRAIEKVVEKQKIVLASAKDQDVIGLTRKGEQACIVVFSIRSGKLIGREHFVIDETVDMTNEELLATFFEQFYMQVHYIPKEIMSPYEPTEMDIIIAWLERKREAKVSIKVPKRGESAQLLEMAVKNAEEELRLHRAQVEQAKLKIQGALLGLKEYLNLEYLPRRIECYDISNTQGTESVASMVVFIDGKPRNDLYRRFKIKTVEGPNDFASMQEVIGRRFSRADKERKEIVEGKLEMEKAKFAELPSVVIIDGGKGQLSAAREIMRETGFGYIPTFGLAKENEWLFAENNPEPIILPRNSESLYMLQRLRDEAHRFAITYHRNLRGKKSLKSILDDIPGIGVKRRKLLVEHFRTMANLRNATVEEISKVPGIPQNVAELVFEHFQQEE